MKESLLDKSYEEIKKIVNDLGEKSYRAEQLYSAINSGLDIAEITTISAGLKCKLLEIYDGQPVTIKTSVKSKDGTEKFLFLLRDGNMIEGVLMRYTYGNTLCVSTQVGCRMNCAFCASGLSGLIRDLSAGEMLGEVVSVNRYLGGGLGEKRLITNVVLMGSGEPLDNYEQVVRFIRIMSDEAAGGISQRAITVSTCGLIPMIDRFGDDFPQVNLAISLHAADSKERSEIMPVNKAYPLDELIDACRRYTEKTGRRITFEYTLINGVNDDRAHLDKLSTLLKGMLCHVNLIPLNEVKEKSYRAGSRERAEEFKEALEKRGIPATVRRELGSDIDAACGQLRVETQNTNT